MNLWQKVFLGLGVLALAVVCLFPPQIVGSRSVMFMPVMDGYPIDWFRLFLWIVAILFITGLGVAVNKSEHL